MVKYLCASSTIQKHGLLYASVACSLYIPKRDCECDQCCNIFIPQRVWYMNHFPLLFRQSLSTESSLCMCGRRTWVSTFAVVPSAPNGGRIASTHLCPRARYSPITACAMLLCCEMKRVWARGRRAVGGDLGTNVRSNSVMGRAPVASSPGTETSKSCLGWPLIGLGGVR